ncbi:unnamed protein product [Lymnaea stagnalis]|uniref:Neugrin n=1 Tax=Lymnaea stagnalis TaxID=6523 RepID=A0AAV2HIC3_LYMST
MPMMSNFLTLSSLLLKATSITFNKVKFGNILAIQSIYRSYATHIPLKLKPVKVTTSTKRGTNPNKRTTKKGQIRKEHFSFADESYNVDELAHRITKYSSKSQALAAKEEFMRDAKKEIKFITAKTIERKYFKKPEVPNLLTWTAKEQIRFLHEKDPLEWTIEKLANSFPVNKECVKKILKNPIRLHREEDIIKHDLQVQQNWIDLKSALDNGDSTIFGEEVYRELKSLLNEDVICNASGIKHLPFPHKKTKSFTADGPFSSIVEDCYENKQVKLIDNLQLQNKLARLSLILSDISKALDKKNSADNSTTPKNNEQSSEVPKKSDPIENENNTFSKYNDRKASFINDQLQYHPSSIPSLLKQSLKTDNVNRRKRYISGNSMYDENGEFLYRIP